MDFEEDDVNLINALSSAIDTVVENVFPPCIELNGRIQLRCEHSVIELVTDSQLTKMLHLVEENLGAYYSSCNGKHWKINKIEEMREPGLVYLWLTDGSDNLAGFISFMLTYSEQKKVLYLYEIQINPAYQNQGIGSKLLEGFHKLSEVLRMLSQQNSSELCPYLLHSGIALTVFSANEKALKWYLSSGYSYTPNSPRNKRVRSRLIKPDYYLLWKLS